MKSGGGGGSGYSSKKRWRGLVIGVLGLVILSMLVPLVFLLGGLHNGFHSPGYASEQQASSSNAFRGYDKFGIKDFSNNSEGDQSGHVNALIRRLGPTLSKLHIKKNEFKILLGWSIKKPKLVDAITEPSQKDMFKNSSRKPTNGTISVDSVRNNGSKRGFPVPHQEVRQSSSVTNNTILSTVDEGGKQCELKYGSYCLWRRVHREDMKDSMVKKLKDQLFVARAYYPSIAKLPAQDKLSRELKQNIQELERIFSESTTDADLPPQSGKKLQRIEAAIARAKSFSVDCNNVDKKLRQIFDMTEDEANFHMKQSAFLYQLAVQTMPKSLHCLSMRLTVEYFKSPVPDVEISLSEKYMDPALYHYVIFSNNVLASSVVINSTVMHARESANLVFHVLTNGQNYFAMKLWFFRNTYKEATVQVLNIEDLNLENHNLHLSLPVEFRISFHSIDSPPAAHIRTEYLSIFSHTHYLLPKIFQNLKKVVVLDDDVVVQQDLSELWSLNMEGKVNGAVQLCSVKLSMLKRYLGQNSFNVNTCAWMSGLNVLDLDRWRELDLSETYQRLVKELSMQEEVSEAVAWRASLLTFQDLIFSLDEAWSLCGLGHDYGLDLQAITNAAVLHYNGNMKPWLELGIAKYRNYWKKFMGREDQFLSDCNINS